MCKNPLVKKSFKRLELQIQAPETPNPSAWNCLNSKIQSFFLNS